MKQCSKCKEVKSFVEFNKSNTKKDGYHNLCRLCSNKLSKEHYENNKEHYLVSIKKRSKIFKQERRKFLNNYKKEAGCKFCPENEPCCLDFHHLNPESKENEISMMMESSFEKLQTEINKCIVVCSNCHRKLHAKILLVP